MASKNEERSQVTLWSEVSIERIKQRLAEITEQIEQVYRKSGDRANIDDSQPKDKR